MVIWRWMTACDGASGARGSPAPSAYSYRKKSKCAARPNRSPTLAGRLGCSRFLRYPFTQSVMEACERILIAPQRQDEVCLVPTSCGAQTPVRVHQEVRGDMLRYRLADYLDTSKIRIIDFCERPCYTMLHMCNLCQKGRYAGEPLFSDSGR
jgi:hypothetical protein